MRTLSFYFTPILFCFYFIEYNGKVMRVIDGDTIELLDNTNTTYRIRLEGIDAPEKRQEFGSKSREYLSDLIAGKTVRVVHKGRDRYGRIIGEVYVKGTINVNAEMVRAGYAWHYKRYSKSKVLEELEITAKKNKIGLWAGNNPIAPWNFRKTKKKVTGTL